MECHDRERRGKKKRMTTDSIDPDTARPAPAAEPPKAKREPTNKAKPGKKATQAEETREGECGAQ